MPSAEESENAIVDEEVGPSEAGDERWGSLDCLDGGGGEVDCGGEVEDSEVRC